MSTTTPATEVVTITVPFTLKREQPKVSHFHEVRAEGERHLGAILVLANSTLEHLGVQSTAALTIEITAVKSEPGMLIDGKTLAQLEDDAKPPVLTKAEQTLLDRHAKLREAHATAFAAFESSDAPLDSPAAKKLATKRDTAFAKLAPVAAKLRAAGYELRNDDSAPTKA